LVFPIILGLVLVGALIFTVKEYVFLQSHEQTDDAQVDGDISPVIARVSGYVMEIRFKDNQHVNAGDTLVVLDDRDYKIKLDQAVAAQNAAQKNVAALGRRRSQKPRQYRGTEGQYRTGPGTFVEGFPGL
jgi:membrane fusion protein (multidrug efflux system)